MTQFLISNWLETLYTQVFPMTIQNTINLEFHSFRKKKQFWYLWKGLVKYSSNYRSTLIPQFFLRVEFKLEPPPPPKEGVQSCFTIQFNLFSLSHNNKFKKYFYCKIKLFIDDISVIIDCIDYRYYKNENAEINWIVWVQRKKFFGWHPKKSLGKFWSRLMSRRLKNTEKLKSRH